MLLGCRSLGTPLGMLLGPSMALLAPRLETSGSSIPEWGRAVPLGCARGRTLFPWQALAALGAALGAGSSTVLGYHPAQRGPGVGESRQWVPPAPAELPRQRCQSSALLVCSPLLPATSRPARPQPLPSAPNCCHPPPLPGGSQQVPGLGLQLEAGAAFAAFPWHRHHSRRFAAALPAPGWELAPAGAAD